jgi:hypothetical protein
MPAEQDTREVPRTEETRAARSGSVKSEAYSGRPGHLQLRHRAEWQGETGT